MSNEDIDMALAQVRYLERENRALRRTLRDEFAMAALTGYLASFNADGDPVEVRSAIARDIWALADALLESRKSCPA